eukprot:390604_1
MATSELLAPESAGQLNTNDNTEATTANVLVDGSVCGLYNQPFVADGTQCKIECYLPSTTEYIVIVLSTNSRMIVNSSDVKKLDIDLDMGNGDSSPTNEQLLHKNKSQNLRRSQNGRDYKEMAHVPEARKTRRTIVFSV